MTARKLEWLDPIVDNIIAVGKQKVPTLFEYLDLLVACVFELTIIIIVARLHHLNKVNRTDLIAPINDRLMLLLATAPPAPPTDPLSQIQAMTGQCLGIRPLTEATISGLRQVPKIDRKNCYRRITDAVEVLGEVQIHLLALAYEEGAYEDFFSLDLSLPLDLQE